MQTLIEQIDSGTLWSFPGGIHPAENKTLSNQTPIEMLPLPERLYIPITQHIGAPGGLLVKVGDHVLKGQPLTAPTSPMALPVHAPTSGTIEAIGNWISAHPSGLEETTITLVADGQDSWIERSPIDTLDGLDNTAILAKILNAGVAGLGGATFPSHIKLSPYKPTELLLINAAECEPYITADDLLMREFAAEIIKGLSVLDTLLSPKRILFGIEDNKPQAIAAIKQAIANSDFDDTQLQLKVIPTKYPSGSEKQLIQILTGQEVPSGKIPAELGIVMHNVGSVFAIKRAVFDDEPLIERVVTVTGERTKAPGNYWVRLGTPIDWLLKQTKFKPQLLGQKVIMGGPMMGFTLPNLKAPVIKSTNCLLLPSRSELPNRNRELACIRCGECAKACPQQLLPQQLYWHAKAKELDKAKALNLNDCIECGACAFVCPSEIPLVQYYRVAKSEIRQDALKQQKSEAAKIRFDARQARLEKEKQERENRHKAASARRKATTPAADSDAVKAALARIKGKQDEQAPAQDMAALREQRKAEARARKAEKAQLADAAPAATDAKPASQNAAVAAAIARAKAKKAASQGDAPQAATSEADKPADPKKAAVAAAIARAKAKQAAAAGTANASKSANTDSNTEAAPSKAATSDPRKAAVAAAIAKAKAKQAAQQGAKQAKATGNEPKPAEPSAEIAREPETAPAADPRKAAVAAAIAKAKAKQAAKQAKATGDEPKPAEPSAEMDSKTKTAPAADPRKAAVAAAIAKAKAKQAAEKAKASGDELKPAAPSAEIASEPETAPAADPRKAAVAAAIAKAKAKQAAPKAAEKAKAAGGEPTPAAPQAEAGSETEAAPAAAATSDPRKAAIARAIAKAKAKQAAQQNNTDNTEN
ncbi:electron transport complex subunit RsxC [Ferrimonas aestuarii]|uniref:Ion-translocating oxidoreductase complex subunit C n=1 Tax=Ferrimonas aestuarii TaxID=2569539 RepID=A0A4U1BPF9_9GAMM|nr:electron transport complex subunit RsxC [Ferrimonas aestuarii]TKB54289.1 electron transport complex subunit RsxC [Ferrimonas aestuarii]